MCRRSDQSVWRLLCQKSEISDSSNGRLTWHSQFVPVGEPTWLDAPIGSTWSVRVPRLGFFTHARHAPVEVRRFAIGATAEVGVGPGGRLAVCSEFRQADQPVALGAAYSADGVLFEVVIPNDLLETAHEASEKWRAIRTARYLIALGVARFWLVSRVLFSVNGWHTFSCRP